MNADALEILKKVKSGELSVDEGAQRLQELENQAGTAVNEPDLAIPSPAVESRMPDSTVAPQIIEPKQQEEPASKDNEPNFEIPDLGWWKKSWMIPFWIGTGILVFGALMMGWAYSSQSFFWFYCAWLPMLGGLLVLLLSWWSQQARWVHVRVQDAGGTRVAVSLPIPLSLAGWAFRVFGRFIPNMEQKVLDELPEIFGALAREKGPTTVEVDDENGSRVRVYIV